MLGLLNKFFTQKEHGLAYRVSPYTYFNDSRVSQKLFEEGYCIVDFIDNHKVQLLLNLYNNQLSNEVYEMRYTDNESQVGAYQGLISEEIHKSIGAILRGTLDEWFNSYKNIINAFSIKTPGGDGKVPIHQDATAVDEEMFSPVTIWIALQDVGLENGALYLIPKSHHIFSPYRGATIDRITINVDHLLTPLFIPTPLKAGQALIFDSRILHFSPPNFSPLNRVAVNCRICPSQATIMVCYADTNQSEKQIELWACPNDFFFNKENHDSGNRPVNCTFNGHRVNKQPLLDEKGFAKVARALGII
jgi:hypothetical protein